MIGLITKNKIILQHINVHARIYHIFTEFDVQLIIIIIVIIIIIIFISLFIVDRIVKYW